MVDGSWRPYGRSDKVVEAEFKRGHAAEQAMATWLRSLGLAAIVTPQKIRKEFKDRRKSRDPGYDLTVEGRRIEVRHRAGYAFTGPDDFPFDDGIWFDNTERWNAPGRPRAPGYLLVSGRSPHQLTGVLAIVEEDYGQVYQDRRWDSTRQEIRDATMIPNQYALSLDQFVAWVKGLPVPKRQPISFTEGFDEDGIVTEDQLARYQRGLRDQNRRVSQAQRRREHLARRAIEDLEKRTWIAEGNDERQPPEYRGVVFDVADADGVHPTAFPPIREGAGGELTEEFIAFQQHNQTRYETHPEYYCVDCKIRYNARHGGTCGPCLGKSQPTQPTLRGRPRPEGPQYPL